MGGRPARSPVGLTRGRARLEANILANILHRAGRSHARPARRVVTSTSIPHAARGRDVGGYGGLTHHAKRVGRVAASSPRSEASVKILVALKRLADPDNANKVKIPSSGDRIDTTGLEWK